MPNPNALIFGASGFLGGALARECIRRACPVGLHGFNRLPACETLRAAATAAGVRADVFPADVLDATALTSVVTNFIQRYERLDTLVWSVGATCDAPLAALPLTDFRRIVDVQLKALFVALKAASRQFLRQRAGSVLVVSSHAARAGRAGGSAYAAAHAGVLALVKSAAREWGASGVRVNAVLPPFFDVSAIGGGASAAFAAHAAKKRVLRAAPDVDAFARFALDCALNPNLSGQALTADSRPSL
jgi:3-oxoacyl-[acyl-carrier protein] reductase